MYWPTGTARRLAQASAVPAGHDTEIIAFAPSPRKSLFCTVTRDGLALWRVRVRPAPISSNTTSTSYSRPSSSRTSRVPPILLRNMAKTKPYIGHRTRVGLSSRSAGCHDPLCFVDRLNTFIRQTSRISFSYPSSMRDNSVARHTTRPG